MSRPEPRRSVTRLRGSMAAGSSSTWWTCRSSARSHRWSSPFSPTGISTGVASATGSNSPTSRPWTGLSPRPSPAVSCLACSAAKAFGLSPSSTPARSTRPAGGSFRSTAVRRACDLAVVVPAHGGQAYIGRSPGLGDALGFVPCDERTLQAKASPDIFVIGDAADIRASKAGSVAHFEGETLVRNIRSFLDRRPLSASYDGHTNCFIESGHGKALPIDYNYDTEPVPGRFPGRAGLPLLKESRLNHLGKLGFQQFYWHVLLPGRDVPGLGAGMPRAGKRIPAAAGAETLRALAPGDD